MLRLISIGPISTCQQSITHAIKYWIGGINWAMWKKQSDWRKLFNSESIQNASQNMYSYTKNVGENCFFIKKCMHNALPFSHGSCFYSRCSKKWEKPLNKLQYISFVGDQTINAYLPCFSLQVLQSKTTSLYENEVNV